MNTPITEKSNIPEIAGDPWLEHWVEIIEDDFASIEVDDFILID